MNINTLTNGTKVLIADTLKEWESDRAMCGKVAIVQGRNWGDETGTSYSVQLQGSVDKRDLWSGDIASVLQ